MKNLITIILSFLFLLMAACSAKVDSPMPLAPASPTNEDPTKPKDSSNNNSDGFPSYKETSVDGQLYAENWVAKSAFVRKFGSEEKKAIIFLLPVSTENPCKYSFQNSDATVSIVVPQIIEQTEYLFDYKSGSKTTNPALIYRQGLDQVSADITKMKIGKIEKNKFNLSIYVKAIDSKNRLSEINGTIEVTDCRNE